MGIAFREPSLMVQIERNRLALKMITLAKTVTLAKTLAHCTKYITVEAKRNILGKEGHELFQPNGSYCIGNSFLYGVWVFNERYPTSLEIMQLGRHMLVGIVNMQNFNSRDELIMNSINLKETSKWFFNRK